jgi:uncharacterized protein (DUF2147 family)
MKKLFRATLFFILSSCSLLSAQEINGLWKILNEDTNKPRTIVAIYEHGGKRYGRIIATYDKEGIMDETIDNPHDRAPGVVGDPFYCGLDLIWDLQNRGETYKGKICDPRKGNVYNAELWMSGKNLVVRGELFIFGKNQKWPPASAADFPKDFKMPDISKFVPVIPVMK